jgi:hypothetical protein
MEQVSSSWYGPDDGYQAETGRPVINSLLDLPPRSVWLLQARLLIPNTACVCKQCSTLGQRKVGVSTDPGSAQVWYTCIRNILTTGNAFKWVITAMLAYAAVCRSGVSLHARLLLAAL